MSFWRFDNLRAVTGGSWLARPLAKRSDALAIEGLSIDSRTIGPKEAFLALRGERFDGHDFLRDAAAAGSPLLIVDDPEKTPADLPPGVTVLRVADSGKALMRLGGAYRRTLENTRVIAVTGSNGKTTTCRLIHAALSGRLRGSASVKSFNNAIGVPLTLLKVKPGDQYVVCEVGTNSPGEIAELAAILEPDIAVITSIGRAHLERLGGVEGVCREKASLLSYLRPGGCAVVTADAPCLADHLKPIPNVVTFGRSEKAQLRVTHVEHADLGARGVGLRFTINDRLSYDLALMGEHNAFNAAAAAGVARRLGLDDAAIVEGLAAAEGPEMRFAARRFNGIDVYNDAYNANPDSMAAAIQTFSRVGAGAKRRIAVIGEMLELGEQGPDAHREVGEALVAAGNIDAAVVVGELALHTAERLERSWDRRRIHIVSGLTPAALAKIAALFRPGDAVLLKGSRAVRLERVEAAIAAGPPVAAAAAER